jgi:hypothetical protein
MEMMIYLKNFFLQAVPQVKKLHSKEFKEENFIYHKENRFVYICFYWSN